MAGQAIKPKYEANEMVGLVRDRCIESQFNQPFWNCNHFDGPGWSVHLVADGEIENMGCVNSSRNHWIIWSNPVSL